MTLLHPSYVARQYELKLDETTETYTMQLQLERDEGQRSMENLKRIPKPSQQDEWRLYQRFEAEKIKNKEGDKRFIEWQLHRESEKVEREQWIRSRGFNAMVHTPLSSHAADSYPGGSLRTSRASTPNSGQLLGQQSRRRSSVMLEVPSKGGLQIKDPKEDISTENSMASENPSLQSLTSPRVEDSKSVASSLSPGKQETSAS